MLIERLFFCDENDFNSIIYLLELLHGRKVTRTSEEINAIIKKHYCFVARNNELEIVAMILYSVVSHLSADRAMIDNVVVHQNYRKQGIATKLMNCCLDLAEKHEIGVIELTVRSTNEAAINLYKKFGFDSTNIFTMRKVLKPWHDSQ